MNPNKAPGPDGFNALFYQKYWSVVGDEVIAAVLSILQGHAIPPGLNHTHVALIPKKPNPSAMGDFRPISLCNVIYKLVTKVLSNRLKPLLATTVSKSQSAFTLEKLITDNIIVAYEIFHAMCGDNSVGGAMAIKLDISKACEKV